MKKTVLAASLFIASAAPALAETAFYGSARMATFYNITDIGAAGKDADIDTHLQGNSIFGANLSSGDIGGKVELGAGTGTVGTRLLYGTWNFGSGKLTVGQDYNSYYLGSAQVHGDDNASKGYGALWDQRQAQIRFNMNNGLYFAAIQPSCNAAASAIAPAVGGSPTAMTLNSQTAGYEIYLPKMNIGYSGKVGEVKYNIGVVGQTMKIEEADKQVNALLGYGQASTTFGGTSLLGSVSLSQNAGTMGFQGRMVYDDANRNNVTGFEGFLQASQKISDTVSGNVGFGYVYDKSDADGASKDDKMCLFVNIPVVLAKNVSVTPEFSYYDQLDKAGSDEKSRQYSVGAKWQINF